MSKDTIYREDVINTLADMHCKSDEDGYVWIIRSDALARIDALPSAQPEQKTGYWLIKQDHNGSTYGECSRCYSKQYAGHTPYCPYCGSHNGGEQDE